MTTAGADTGQDVTHDAEEAALWALFENGKPARTREKLFFLYRPFARQIARRHFLDRNRGDIELQELDQLAYAGLLEAIDRYDTQHGVPFRPFGAKRITGSILNGLGRMSEYREQLSFRGRIRRERVRSLHKPPLANASSVDAMQALAELAIGLAIGFMLEGTGLVAPEGERDTRADPYESLAWKDALDRVMAEATSLPDRERTIIKLHYVDGLDFTRISVLLSVSGARVSQLHKAAIATLRKRLGARPNFTLVR